MRKSWLMCVLLGTLAWGQAAPSSPPPPQPAQAPPADTSAAVPPEAAVITVMGVCPAQPKTAAAKGTAAKPVTAAKTLAADCKTVITKAQFEELAKALIPNVTPQAKKQLAGVLPRFIGMSSEAKKKGLDKTAQFDQTVKFAKMQILTSALQRNITDEAAKVPPEEIEKYYKEHAETFEQFNLDRLFVPRTKQGDTEAKEEDEKDEKLSEEAKKAKEAEEKTKADEAEQAMAKLAESLRVRAAAGEDFAKLQKEAFDAAGMKIESPTVTLPNTRRTGLPPAHAAVFELKPGEVSQVISDSGGHYIYKVNSKDHISLDQATNEIHSKLQNDRTREMMDKVNSSFKVETNDMYFGPGGVGTAPPPRLPHPRSAPIPTPPAVQPQTPPPAQPPAEKPN
jgi:parvulin-like peptidyl-prolyl cis-trans isomerase-like protein